MSRRKGRILSFQALYCYDAVQPPLENLLEFDWQGENTQPVSEDVLAFAGNITAGTIENLDVIDEKIKERLVNWEFKRLKRVDLAIIRISVYSFLFQKDIPAEVVIEEAIEISRKFGEDMSFKFINGILDSIKKSLREDN